MTNWLKRFAVLTVVALMAAFVCAADQSIEGIVKDAQGGILPGVSVTLTQTDTGLSRNVLTDDNGRYFFSTIKTGNYELKAELDQFAPYRLTGVKVNIGDKLVFDVKLQVAGTTDQITITASTEQVETTSSQLDTVIDSKRISDLPLNGRNPLDLMSLAPGVADSPFGLSANGARARGNNYQLDGVDNNDSTIGGAMTEQNVDATEEFRMITATPSAEYGRAGGAVVDVIVKSGTNQFHGNLFWFNRQDRFDAKTWRENYYNDPKGSYRYDQYGATIGGPILKDKLFFFFNCQFDRQRNTYTQLSLTPNQTFRNSITNAAMRQFFDTYYPLPNTSLTDYNPGAPVNAVAGYYQFQPVDDLKADQYTVKVDYTLNSKHTISGRYFHNPTEYTGPGTLPGPANIGVYYQNVKNDTFALDWTWIATPNFVNNVKFARNRRTGDFPIYSDDPNLSLFNMNMAYSYQYFTNFTSGIGDPQYRENGLYQIKDTVTWNKGNHSFKFGIDFRFLSNDGATNFGITPVYNFAGYTTGSFLNRVRAGRVDYINQTVFSDGEEYQYGLGNYRRLRTREYDFFVQDDWKILPNLTLNIGLRVECKPTPYDKDGLDGNFNGDEVVNNGYRFRNPSNYFDPINYLPGFTWVDYINTLDPSIVDWQGTGASVIMGKKMFDGHTCVAPRVGFSWDPWGNGKTAVRGGYAISYDRLIDNLFGWISAYNVPWAYAGQFSQSGVGATGIYPDQIAYYGHGVDMPDMVFHPAVAAWQNGPVVFQENMKQPTIQTWNFGIQREVHPGMILELTYVGSHGYHQMIFGDALQTQYSQAFIDEAYANEIYNFNYSATPGGAGYWIANDQSLNNQIYGIYFAESSGWSRYDALQASFSHRYRNGLQFQVNYTFGKSFNNAEEIVGGTNTGQGYGLYYTDYLDKNYDAGYSTGDLRHNFNVNFIYELPFGPGKWLGGKTEGVIAQLIGGWQVNGIISGNSGQRLDYRVRYDAVTGIGLAARPDVRDTTFTRSGNLVGPTQANFVWTGDAAIDNPYYGFTHPKGNYYKGFFRGPRYWNVDFSLFKEIKLPWFTSDGCKLQLRLEAFNLFNTVNYANPNRNLIYTAGSGDRPSPNAMGYTFTAYSNRQIQLGAKFIF